MAIRYDFPVDGEYVIKVRLRRQYQDYVMGMGWPQQLDVRLDGALVKRFTVGGDAKGRPAATSYAGDGEPGFAGDDEWEKYMQIGADAGLEVRIPVTAGPRIIGVSFDSIARLNAFSADPQYCAGKIAVALGASARTTTAAMRTRRNTFRGYSACLTVR